MRMLCFLNLENLIHKMIIKRQNNTNSQPTFYFILFFIEVYLTYNIMLVSAAQRKDLAIVYIGE